jgi:hypothetical protein
MPPPHSKVTPMAYCKCMLLCDSLQTFPAMKEEKVMYNTGLSCFHSNAEPFAKFYSQTSRKVIFISERAYAR